ncbi:MAG: Aminocarboxymuconate-semialdehyde decarboxylase [Hyphomicrobiales bacterium]|nr:Aminocarboxymuconate-semialdehyde decarboxylase [Hyphomicrobiales bacterium]
MATSATGLADGPIDVHAHVLMPEIYARTRGHSLFAMPPEGAVLSEAQREQARQRGESVCAAMADMDTRLAAMDTMEVGVQILSASLVHQCSYHEAPRESLALEQRSNDLLAAMSVRHPARFRALGGVPLHAPDLAATELRRCMEQLHFLGVGISTRAGEMELGDERLAPFWEAAEETGALVYVHPAGNHDPRFRKHFLWNSIGQSFEEAMAIASLIYEGVLERFPRLRICISHGGGYMPFYMGRIERNYLEKPTTRLKMTRSPTEYLRMLWYDSCVYDALALRRLAETVGVERIVLGTDYPVGDRAPVDFIASCGFSDEERDAILRDNALRMIAR